MTYKDGLIEQCIRDDMFFIFYISLTSTLPKVKAGFVEVAAAMIAVPLTSSYRWCTGWITDFTC